MRAPVRMRAHQNHIFWKFFDFWIFSKFPTFKVKLSRACARPARIIKFAKYELSAFIGKKINKFGQKAKILEKMKMPTKSEKKGPVYVRACSAVSQKWSWPGENTLSTCPMKVWMLHICVKMFSDGVLSEESPDEISW